MAGKATNSDQERKVEKQIAQLTSEIRLLKAMIGQLPAAQSGEASTVSMDEKLAAIRSRGERVSDFLKRNNGRI